MTIKDIGLTSGKKRLTLKTNDNLSCKMCVCVCVCVCVAYKCVYMMYLIVMMSC